jgi:O-antigen/teichoic acid export membrane protein
LRPFDVSTPDGRSQERHRRVAISTLASIAAKIISVVTTLISIPLSLHYLGVERYGMWMTMSSLVAMLSFADFGIGNGVLNAVANAHGRDRTEEIRRYVSSGFFVLGAIAGAILLLFALAYSFVPWYHIFNVKLPRSQADAGPALAVLVTCFALAIPLNIVQRVQMGLQQGFAASLWQCLGSVLGLAGVVGAIHFRAGLGWLVAGFAGAPLLASLLNSLVFFGRQRRDIAPSPSQVSRQGTLRIAHMGMLFFVLQIMVTLTFAADNIIIAQLLGATAVAQYAVPEKMFSIVSTVLTMMLMPLWPAYGEALARGDRAWARRTLKRSFLAVVGCAALCSAFLVAAAPILIPLWVGRSVTAPLILLLGLGLWKVVEAGGNAFAVYLNGAHIVKAQVVVATTTAIASIALKIFLVPRLGVAGVPWGTLSAYLVFAVLPYFYLVMRPGRGAII